MERIRDRESFQRLLMANNTNLQNHQLSSQNNLSFYGIVGSNVSSHPSLQNQHPFQIPYTIAQTLPPASQQSHGHPSHECGLETSFGGLNLLDANNLHHLRIDSAVRGQVELFHDRFRSALPIPMGGGGVEAITPSVNLPSSRFFGSNHRSELNSNLNSHPASYPPPRRPINRPSNLQCWGLEYENSPSSLRSSSSLYNSVAYHQHPAQQQQHPPPSKYSSLEELRGQVSSVAKDQYGYRFLLKQFDNKIITNEHIEMMLSDVKDELHELMVHQCGYYLILKLFESGNQEQRTQLLLNLVSNEEKFVAVCTDVHGTRSIQKFIEGICTAEERSILLSELKPIAVTLTNNIHGHHIIENCLNNFSDDDIKHIVDEIVEHCLEIATDRSGCCVLQLCLAQAKAAARDRLLADITANAFVLSEHPYGNYVVQYVIGMKVPHITANITVQLRGSYVILSMNKYGSNVVEKCLKEAGEEHAAKIIREIMYDPDFLKVIKDAYGNYVVQSALNVAKGDVYNTLVEFIQHHYASLQSHLFGKKVLAKVLARSKGRKNRV